MQQHSVTLKLTPVGKRVMGFLAVFNMGDEEEMKAYVQSNYHERTLAEYGLDTVLGWHWDLYKDTGGLRIHKVYLTQEHYVVLLTHPYNDPERLFFQKFKVDPKAPHKFTDIQHQEIGSSQAAMGGSES